MQVSSFTQGQTAFAATTSGGRLLGVQVTLQGSTTGLALSIYDNASAASGTLMFQLNGSGTAVAPLGWYGVGVPGVGIPYSNGLWVVSTASTGSVGTIVYSSAPGPFDGRPAT
jgi:hypothetical protein